jgi:hypothetical protein
MMEAERGWRRWGSRDEAWGREGSVAHGKRKRARGSRGTRAPSGVTGAQGLGRSGRLVGSR